jgi:hypothetical protein
MSRRSGVCLLIEEGSGTARDGNLGMSNGYPVGTRSDGYGYGYDYLPMAGIHTRSEPRRVWVRVVFPPAGNTSGTQN